MSDNRWSANRRTFLKTAGAASAVGAAGCLGGEAADIELVLNPAEASVDIQTQYRPIIEHIESEVGVTINTTRTASYTETVTALRDGQAEISGVSPGAVPATDESVFDIIGMRIAFGAAQYFSTITTTMDSGVEELSDLADLDNPQINFSDPLSVSGTLVPLSTLQDAGLDVGEAPDGEPPDFEPNYSDHETSRTNMVERDEVVAAGQGAFQSASWISQEQFDEMSPEFAETSSEYPSAGENIGDEHGELRLLAVSDPLPRAPMVSRADWDDSVREEVESTMLNAPEEAFQHEDTSDVGDNEELWFSGIEEAGRSDYAPIQDVIDNLAIEFEDIS
ncbi:phosphate/phosphite/phosphonate ABC transporter substrate-binding protein [Halorubrum sp. BOL3-1]|uniref:PhnD/SsuA/transferrin family substrate-binding protein n=1 Tax=Halorubrum sp. BOL3-1 TaxID=2497325 RepID=UPI0010050160|nr:PhnD/SsuA/transferrin family substrate-binding protein [Halorubrum sp. BOL3-1]QAU13044.1 phosphate/phosphite/phosphonate ABC transporter substrate-binding protein [Halorubrum sp. BOL3-1]